MCTNFIYLIGFFNLFKLGVKVSPLTPKPYVFPAKNVTWFLQSFGYDIGSQDEVTNEQQKDGSVKDGSIPEFSFRYLIDHLLTSLQIVLDVLIFISYVLDYISLS